MISILPDLKSFEPASASRSLAEAIRLHRMGRLEEAAVRYENVLEAEGAFFGPSYLLGALRRQQGRASAPLPHLQRAVTLEPAIAPAWSQLGLAHKKTG